MYNTAAAALSKESSLYRFPITPSGHRHHLNEDHKDLRVTRVMETIKSHNKVSYCADTLSFNAILI